MSFTNIDNARRKNSGHRALAPWMSIGMWTAVLFCSRTAVGGTMVPPTEAATTQPAIAQPTTMPVAKLDHTSAPQAAPQTQPVAIIKTPRTVVVTQPSQPVLPTLAEVASTQPIVTLGEGKPVVMTTGNAAATPGKPAVLTLPPDRGEPSFNDAPAALLTEQTGVRTQMNVMVNKSVVLTTRVPYKRLSIGQPDIADVNLLSPTDNGSGHIAYNMLLTGKKPGTTQVIVWDDTDRAQVLDVNVQIDVTGLQDQLRQLFPNLALDVRAIGGTAAIKGHVPSLAIADQVLQVAKPYSPSILDLMEVSGGQQVMLSVKIAEVSRVASSSLGVNFGFTDGHSFAGSNIGNVNALGTTAGRSGENVLSAPSPNPAVSLFGQAMLGRESLAYFIQAMRENNLLRMLAEPNVMAISGQEASFLAGGEYPIPVASGSSGSITIEYREYGVKLKFVPVVLGDGKIRLKVSPEVSDLDYANAVKIGGVVIPGLTQRKVSTTVELADGQSFAVAGLLNNSVAADTQAVPLLGSLPVLGPLFRSVRYARKETELVVLVTPHLVEPMNPVQVGPLPGQNWRTPSEAELFWKADMGGVAAADASHRPLVQSGQPGSAPMFHGSFGFNAIPAKDGPKPTGVATSAE